MPALFGKVDLGYVCPTCNGTGFRAAGWMNRGPHAGWDQCRNICHACAGAGSVDPVVTAAVGTVRYVDDLAFADPNQRRSRSVTRDKWVAFFAASDKPSDTPDFFDQAEHAASLERNGVSSEDLVWQAYELSGRRGRRWNVSRSDFPGILRQAMHKASTASNILISLRARLAGPSSRVELLPEPAPDPILRPVFADDSLELEAWM